MGVWGAIIMSFFGAVFATLTLHSEWHVDGAVLAAPFAVCALIVVAAVQVMRRPGSVPAPSERAARAITWSSIGEGVGLFVVANILVNLNRTDLMLPAMALVVGLHFLPIACAAAFRPFYALAAALIVLAGVGAVLPAPAGPTLAGSGAALSLWTAAAFAVVRDARLKAMSRQRGG